MELSFHSWKRVIQVALVCHRAKHQMYRIMSFLLFSSGIYVTVYDSSPLIPPSVSVKYLPTRNNYN